MTSISLCQATSCCESLGRISRQAAHRKDSRLRRATTATIPRQAGNDSTLTLQAKREKEEKRETSKDSQIGKRGRGLCERSEFRSPRARRRRASEKARYGAAVLLGSFFSPKRRMNKKSPSWIPRRAENDSPLTLQAKREKEEKRETSKDSQIGKRGNRPYRAGRAAAESGKRARTV